MHVFVYVDDLLIFHEDEEEIIRLGQTLNKEFETKDFGELRHYFDIQIEPKEDSSNYLSQSCKITALLHKFGLSEAKGASMLMDMTYS